MYYNSGVDFGDILDGTAYTLQVGEVRGYRPHSRPGITRIVDWRGQRWEVGTATYMQPINAIHGFGCTNCRWENMASFHPGGTHGLMADGSVSFIAENIESDVFLWMGSMGDEEPISIP